MSDTPEGNICKVSANLGWASDTLAVVDKALLKLSAEVKTILRERDNFQDHRDFAMNEIERLRKERDEARETITRLNRRLTNAEGIITAAGLVENRPKSGGGSLGRALANYAAEQWKDIAERSIGYVYDNDWDPEACDIIKDYEKLAGGPHPIHSR